MFNLKLCFNCYSFYCDDNDASFLETVFVLFCFQVNDFQHVRINYFEDSSSYVSCSCQTFNFSNDFTDESGPVSNCCHCRLVKDIEDPQRNLYINCEKVQKGKLQSNTLVVVLPSKRDTEKFSVIGSDSTVSFVSTYLVNSRPMIHCHTGRCQLCYGKARRITTLSSENICVHLEEVRKFKEIDDNDDESTDFTDFTIPDEKVHIFFLSIAKSPHDKIYFSNNFTR